MRGRKRMMCRRPALSLFIPLEHRKISDPQEAKVLGCVTRFLESSMPLGVFRRQRQTQQSRSRMNRVVVLLDLWFDAAGGFVFSRFTIAGNHHDQVISRGGGLLANLGSSFGKVFLQPFEIFK